MKAVETRVQIYVYTQNSHELFESKPTELTWEPLNAS